MTLIKKDDETINKDVKTGTLKTHNKSYLIYSSSYSFYKYHDIRKTNKLSFRSKYSYLCEFYYDLDKFNGQKTQNEKNKREKKCVYTVSELYNKLLEIYFDEYYDLSNAKRTKMDYYFNT